MTDTDEAVWMDGWVSAVLIGVQKNACPVCGDNLRLAGPVLEWVAVGDGDPVPIVIHAECVSEISRTEHRTIAEVRKALAGDRSRVAENALTAALNCQGWYPKRAAVLADADRRIAAAKIAERNAVTLAAKWQKSCNGAVEKSETATKKSGELATQVGELQKKLAATTDRLKAWRQHAEQCRELLRLVVEATEPDGMYDTELLAHIKTQMIAAGVVKPDP